MIKMLPLKAEAKFLRSNKFMVTQLISRGYHCHEIKKANFKMRTVSFSLCVIIVLLACIVFASCETNASTAAPGKDYVRPNKPGSWICLTTAGGANIEGGHVNRSWCKVDSGNASTNSSHGGDRQQWLGWIGIVIAVVFFGSNYIPIKNFDTGDGMFFQWIVCVGIWLVGLVVNMILYQPPFFLPAILGGVLWTTGNLMVVPIVKMIGLTMGLTIWGVTNMLAGWSTGKFILKQEIACAGLNYGGVATVIVSVIVLAFVKSEGKKVKPEDEMRSNSGSPVPDETSPLINPKSTSLHGSLGERVIKRTGASIQAAPDDQLTFSRSSNASSSTSSPNLDADYSWVDKLGVWPRRVLGFMLSLISGLFYGFLFLPVQMMKLCNDEAHSCSDVNYIFGTYTGILLTSTIYFIVYAAFKRNQPVVYPKVIIPALIAGIMWGIAMMGWFLANQHLSLEVAFPMVTAGPGFVSSLWGIILYREIKGPLSLILYFTALTICIGGLVMDALSKKHHC